MRQGRKAGLLVLLCFSPLLSMAQYNVDRLILSGKVALHYEDYVLSIQYFNQAISRKPYLWAPWQLRAIAKYYLDDWHGAEADATKAIELNPYITSLYDLRGISRIRLDKYDGAIEDYSKAKAIAPDNRYFWNNRAVCYMERKDYDKAQRQTDTIIARWERYAPTYLLKAEVFMNQRDTVSAEKWIERSLAVDSFNANAWRVRASLALQKERWKDADDFFSRTLHLRPKDTESLVNRAVARLKLNNLRGAMSDYDDALEIMPNNFLAHYNRGLLRLQVGDDNKAIEDFDYVLTFEPENYMALFNRATLLERTGDLQGAIRDYTKVIDEFPNFWTGLRYRAECYRKLGMTAKAEQDEFRVLKAQMDKRLGIQQRWSRSKVDAIRKQSDIDPEKYNQLVVEDETVAGDEDKYQSEYRGRVQNRNVAEQYQPYLALTMGIGRGGVVAYAPFDARVEAFGIKVNALAKEQSLTAPTLGVVGEGLGIPTDAQVDRITEAIQADKDGQNAAALLLLRSVAYSSAQNYKAALDDINASLEKEPDSFVALWQRAVCGAMVLEYEKGLSKEEAALRKAGVTGDFDRLVSMDKTNAYVLYCYGTFCARMEDYDRAVELLTRAVGVDAHLPYAYYNRGLASLHSDNVQQARQDFSKAGELGLYSAYSLMRKKQEK